MIDELMKTINYWMLARFPRPFVIIIQTTASLFAVILFIGIVISILFGLWKFISGRPDLACGMGIALIMLFLVLHIAISINENLPKRKGK